MVVHSTTLSVETMIPLVIRDVVNSILDQITSYDCAMKCSGFEPLLSDIHGQLAPSAFKTLELYLKSCIPNLVLRTITACCQDLTVLTNAAMI